MVGLPMWLRVFAALSLVVALGGCRAEDRARLLEFVEELEEIANEEAAPILGEEEALRLATQPEFPVDALREGHWAEVHHVVDGDTLDLRVGEKLFKIRFKGASAPECHKDQERVGGVLRYKCNEDDEYYGLASYQELLQIIGKTPVRVACEQEQAGTACEQDAYGRWLANIVTLPGTDVGEELLRRGAGFTSTAFPSKMRKNYCLAEYQARDQGRGMWEGKSVEETLLQMSEQTQRWYRAHDARCDAAIREL